MRTAVIRMLLHIARSLDTPWSDDDDARARKHVARSLFKQLSHTGIGMNATEALCSLHRHTTLAKAWKSTFAAAAKDIVSTYFRKLVGLG
jgi:hypothetical protein